MKLIQPIFINETKSKVTGLGVANKSYKLSDAIARIKLDTDHNVSSFLLFLVPNNKSWDPLWEWQKNVLSTIRTKFPNIEIYVDTCMCSTLPDGHCCVLKDARESEEVLQRLVRIIEHANCKVAHSDMGVNTALNARTEFPDLEIMSYVKWRSNLYEGFRSTANSTPESLRTYQIEVDDPQGFKDIAHKYINDGCDSILLKPGITSIDMLHYLRQHTDMPIGGYQVSGEWLPIKDNVANIQEQYKVYKRYGFDYMVSYAARMFTLFQK